ncbi:MAG: VOC family protein [Pseudomonadota bacterium]
MRFVNPLPFVADIGRSKTFYADVLGLQVEEDHGNFVKFSNGFALHDGASLTQTIFGKPPSTTDPYGRQNLVLYFESDDIRDAFERISPHADVIHPIRKQSWGQLVFRFYDPDGHIVEVGEPDVSPD